MTAVRPVLIRFASMLALSVVVWTAIKLIYATVAGVPFDSVLKPSAINVGVVLMVCFIAALPRNTP